MAPYGGTPAACDAAASRRPPRRVAERVVCAPLSRTHQQRPSAHTPRMPAPRLDGSNASPPRQVLFVGAEVSRRRDPGERRSIRRHRKPPADTECVFPRSPTPLAHALRHARLATGPARGLARAAAGEPGLNPTRLLPGAISLAETVLVQDDGQCSCTFGPRSTLQRRIHGFLALQVCKR